jgi:hypothetical protein
MLFVHSIRTYMNEKVCGRRGWVAGLSDPQLGKVIELLHAQTGPLNLWRQAPECRDQALHSRFKLIVGQSPLEYLTHWPIHRASVKIV